MGRKKIQISRITDERNRQVTFNKRKFGVMKKAYELSVLCDCEIALIIFSSSNKLYQYASTDMDKVLLKYTEYNEPHESLTNKNIIEALNKKEHKGAMSPESPEPDAIEYNLTPRTEAKYTKIDEEFQMMMQRHQHNGSRTMGQSNYTLPVSVPVNSYGESLLGSSPQMAHTSISPRPSSSETDSVYPPGGMLEMSNGYPPSASPLGGSPSPGPSPALGVGGGSANKGSNPSRHSPQPPPPPPPPHPHRANLRVVIPTPLTQPLSEDTNYDNAHTQSALNTPVVALQTPTVPAAYSSFGPTDYSSDLGSLAWSHQRYVDDLSMYSAATMSSISGLPHLAVSSSTPPPSTSPLPVKIKSEPISPPRDPLGGNSGSGGPSNASNLHHTNLNVGPSSSTGGPPPHHVSHPGPQTLNLVSSRPSSNSENHGGGTTGEIVLSLCRALFRPRVHALRKRSRQDFAGKKMNHCGESSDDTDDGDDQEASSLQAGKNFEDALTSFREQWQRELTISPKHDASKTPKQPSLEVANDEASIESKAKNLFLKGIEHEQSRKFYEAIQFYKRAVQLVPDIEVRLYESTNAKPRDKYDADDCLDTLDNDISANNDNENHNEADEEESDLFLKLSKIVNPNRVCFPKFDQSTTHISALPMEIVLYILKWVVSSELDFRSLEMFSRVCRGFYITARDKEIWRLACVRVWGMNCGSYEPLYQSWRDMYLQRPRLRYNGCYISKTSYIRDGENNFQDRFYRPWHLVEYYRYFRFFPEGKVLMLTSTDEAQSCVNSLRNRVPRNPSVLIGHYRLHDNYVTLVLKKQETKSVNFAYKRKKREPVHDSGEQTFHIEFEIQNHHRRVNSQLRWMSYSIFTKYKNGVEAKICLKEPSMREFRVSPIGGRYPPLKFNRVKSYTQESEALLQ